MDYIYRYDVAAIIVSISILISLIRNKTIHTRMVNTFEIWFITIILASVFDFAAIWLMKNPTVVPLWVHYLVNMGYHIFFIFIPQIFYYSIYFSTEDNKIPPRWKRISFSIPYFLVVVIILSTPFTGATFSFDENLVYQRGPLFLVNYITAGFYLFFCIYRSVRYRQHFSPYQFFSVCFFMIFSIATLIIQYFFPRLMLMNFSIAVSAMIGYLSLENPSDYIDKEMPMYNRNGFIEYMNHYLYKRKDITILGLQIVGFKSMGNAIGRNNKLALLQQLGKDMLLVSPMNRNFRISQSRFAILLDDDVKKQQKQIEDIIEYSLRAFKVGDVKLLISVKSVVIKCPEDASTVDDIIELMEHSFNKTVTLTDNKVPRADRNVLLKRYGEQKMLEKIKAAINDGNFDVYYHPVFDTKLKKYSFAEALIRVKTNNEMIVSPEDFLPITEKSGMLIKIGDFVLESVCRYIVDTKPYEHGIEFISINLTVLQCMQENLAKRILSVLNIYKVDPKFIRFEVSESATLLANNVLLSNMKELYEHGVRFALNNFGVGLSNIANIVKFPISAIKIDKSMVQSAIKEKKAAVILKENISMIKDMGLKVITDCVENEEQNNLLIESGCDYIQGYNSPLPLNTNDFTQLILQ